MSSEIWPTKKNFCDLKSTFKAVNFFPSCKNEIRVSLFNTIFCNTTTYFMVIKRLFNYNFVETRLTS